MSALISATPAGPTVTPPTVDVTPATPPPGLAGSLLVFQARVADLLDLGAKLDAMLEEADRRRTAGFGARDARHRFVACRGLLRLLLGRELDCDPATIRLTCEPGGKPTIASPAGGRRLRFNLSHSGDVVLIALSWAADVGVDVEGVRPLPRAERLARRILSEREHVAWRDLTPGAREDALIQSWTRKEAVLKGDGSGVRGSPRRVELAATSAAGGETNAMRGRGSTVRPGRSGWLQFHHDDAHWVVHDLAVPSSHRAAVAVRRAPWPP